MPNPRFLSVDDMVYVMSQARTLLPGVELYSCQFGFIKRVFNKLRIAGINPIQLCLVSGQSSLIGN